MNVRKKTQSEYDAKYAEWESASLLLCNTDNTDNRNPVYWPLFHKVRHLDRQLLHLAMKLRHMDFQVETKQRSALLMKQSESNIIKKTK